MKILFVTSRLPYRNIVSGHKIVYQRIGRLIGRGHQVGLVCYTDEQSSAFVGDMQSILTELHTLPMPKPRHPVRNWLSSMVTGVPWGLFNPGADVMRRLVGDVVERSRYEVVVAEFTENGQYIHRNPCLPAVRTVVSCHQSPTVALDKRIEVLGFTAAGLLARVGRDRLHRYEFGLYRSADRVLTLTAHEHYQLRHYAPDLRVTVIPSGVDTTFFRPPVQTPRPNGIVFTGMFGSTPNRDAVRWFCTRVWPLVRSRNPGLLFYVIGPKPTQEMQEYAFNDPQIVITGEIPDIRSYLARSHIFVCPMRLGSGMYGKVLEAMACGIPVVSTSLGVEGMPSQSGHNCFIADTPELFADKINILLKDEPLRRHIATQARDLVCRRFSWDRNVEKLEQVLADVVKGR